MVTTASSSPIAHVVVIDPAIRTAEVDCFNLLLRWMQRPATYHLPGLFGTGSLEADRPVAADVIGVIILGSATSVHEAPPWQDPVQQWLLTAAHAGIPVLGICYGHQLLAHAFGGTVVFGTPDKKKRTGFAEVTLTQNKWPGGVTGSGDLFFSHREYVKTLPPVLESIAKSQESAFEALTHKTLPIWTLQAHPEATRSFVARHGMLEPEERFGFGWELLKNFCREANARHSQKQQAKK